MKTLSAHYPRLEALSYGIILVFVKAVFPSSISSLTYIYTVSIHRLHFNTYLKPPTQYASIGLSANRHFFDKIRLPIRIIFSSRSQHNNVYFDPEQMGNRYINKFYTTHLSFDISRIKIKYRISKYYTVLFLNKNIKTFCLFGRYCTSIGWHIMSCGAPGQSWYQLRSESPPQSSRMARPISTLRLVLEKVCLNPLSFWDRGENVLCLYCCIVCISLSPGCSDRALQNSVVFFQHVGC